MIGEALLHSAAASGSYQVGAGGLVGLAAMRSLTPEERGQLFRLLDDRWLDDGRWEPLAFEDDGYPSTVDCLARA
ncbi:MAG: hypothetical protein ACRDYV_08010, partial [Acidimicrobiia bacterium]